MVKNFELEKADIQFALKCGKYLVIAIIAALALKLTWELFKNAGIAMVEDFMTQDWNSGKISSVFLQILKYFFKNFVGFVLNFML